MFFSGPQGQQKQAWWWQVGSVRSLGDPLGPKFSIWLSQGGAIWDHFLLNSSIYEAKGVQIEAPKYAFRKVLKKR